MPSKGTIKYHWFWVIKRRQLLSPPLEIPLQSDAFWFKECRGYLTTRMFELQLGKKHQDLYRRHSKLESEHINDLGNIFEILRRHKLCLNASKCPFGVGSGKFLGYMVTHHWIEVNLDQIKAINSLQPSRNPKKVHKLIGITTALNRFISQSTNKCRPFFRLLNKWKEFEWTEECV